MMDVALNRFLLVRYLILTKVLCRNTLSMKHRQRSNKDCKEKIQFHHFEDRIPFHQSTRHVLELYKMDTQHYTHDDDDDDDYTQRITPDKGYITDFPLLWAHTSTLLGFHVMADEIGLASESDENESSGANLIRGGFKKTYGLANSEDFIEREEVSINDIIEQLGYGKFQIIITVILGMILLADGCEIMLISLLGPKVRCVWKLSVAEEALINSVVMLGFTFGASFWGFASDKFGRRRCLIASTVNVVYFGVLCSQVPSFKWLLVTRFFVGFNVGCALQVMTMFTEFLPASTRARTIILAELFWVVGSQFAVLLGLGTINSLGWRWFLVISTLPLFIFLLCCKWIPESPRYLLNAGKTEEAVTVLHKVARYNKREYPNKDIVVPRYEVKRGRLKDLFSKEIRFHYIISMFIWFASGFGYYGIVLLGTEMFQTGISGCNPYISAMKSTSCGCHDLKTKDYIDYFLTAFSELPGLFGSTLLVTYIGSKKTVSLQFGLASVFIVLLMVCTSRTTNVILMFGMRGCIAGAWLTVIAYTSETLPTNVRALGIGICNTLSRVGAIVTSFVAQVLLEYSFYVAISVYGMTLIIACVATLLLPKEIKGEPLQEAVGNFDSDESQEMEKLNLRTSATYR